MTRLLTHLLSANILLGLLAAAFWGGGDFAGSMAVKRSGGTVRASLQVVVGGHLLSLLALLLLAPHLDGPLRMGMPLLWSMLGGLISGVALVAFYLALADGHMGSAAAVSGLLCAAIPAVVSAWTEGSPGWGKFLGFALAGVAIWLVAGSGHPGERASRRALWLSTFGGVGFGIYFVALKVGGTLGVLWPTAAARVGSLSVCSLLLLVSLLRKPGQQEVAASTELRPTGSAASPAHPWLSRAALIWIAAGGLLDTTGNLSFVAASRAGRLDVAAVLASIYPAGTILLAAAVLHERTSPRQKLGMLLALPAVVLITL